MTIRQFAVSKKYGKLKTNGTHSNKPQRTHTRTKTSHFRNNDAGRIALGKIFCLKAQFTRLPRWTNRVSLFDEHSISFSVCQRFSNGVFFLSSLEEHLSMSVQKKHRLAWKPMGSQWEAVPICKLQIGRPSTWALSSTINCLAELTQSISDFQSSSDRQSVSDLIGITNAEI